MDLIPKFSVIIPTYQRQELLDAAVASVLEQTITNIEVIVVDDAGSPPATVPDDRRITLLRQEVNGGKAAAINRALELARGEYVAFLDDDDQWTPTRLQTALEAHAQTGCDVVILGLNRAPFDAAAADTSARRIPAAMLATQEMLGNMGTTTVRRTACINFNPSYRASQDLDWALRLQEAGASYAGCAAVEWSWGRHDGPRHKNDQTARIAASYRLLGEHSRWYKAHPAALAYRHYRLGVMHLLQGERRQALGCLIKSALAKPRVEQARLAGSLLRQTIARGPRWG